MKNTKRIFTLLLSSLLLAGSAFTASAIEKDVDYVVIEEVDPDNYVGYADAYPYSVDWDWPECPTGEILKGTIISSFNPDQANNPWCWKNSPTFNASAAFDGDLTTMFDPFEAGERSWAGVILDQAYELTEVRMLVRGKYLERMNGATIQGSNDGEQWVNIVFFGQNAVAEDYHIITPDPITEDGVYADYADMGCEDFSQYWVSEGSYQMYRVINTNGQHGEILELELYGNPAPATEVTWELMQEANVSIESFYNLEIDRSYSDKYSVSIDGSIVGRIIGGYDPDHVTPYLPFPDPVKFWRDDLNDAGWYGAGWDNDPNTMYDPAAQTHNFWTGIEVDEPMIITKVKVMPRFDKFNVRLDGGRIQGSNDGVRWYTLAAFDSTDVPPEGEPTWVEKEVNAPKGFTMFRYVNKGTNHGNIVDVALYGEAAPETGAPETLLGDIDGNGTVDIADAVLLFMNSMLPEEYEITYEGDTDFTKDGSVDIADAVRLFMYSMLPDDYPLVESEIQD